MNNQTRVTLDLVVNVSQVVDTPNLASANTVYVPSGAGFYDGLFALHVQNGTDPHASLPDMKLNINFFHAYNLDKGAPARFEHDFRSLILHEVMHAVGIASFLDAGGQSAFSGSNLGVFTRFDEFMLDASGKSVMQVGGQYTGSVARTTGGDGGLFWGGKNTLNQHKAIKLYTPSTYEGGSSISHWDGQGTSLMKPSLGKGVLSRQISDFEVSALKDIGYANARSPLSTLLSFETPRKYKESGFAQAGVVSEIYGFGTKAYLQINSIGGKSYLNIYKNFDLNQKQILELDDDYTRMSPLRIAGPQSSPGVVLSTRGQHKILTLAGIKASQSTILSYEDFEYVHRVQKRGTRTQAYDSRTDHHVVVGDLNDDLLDDILTYTPNWGFRRFLNDKQYNFDGWHEPKTVISRFASWPIRGISVFDRISTSSNVIPRVDFTSGFSTYHQAINRMELDSGRESILFSANSNIPKGFLQNVQTYSQSGVGVFVEGNKNFIVQFKENAGKYSVNSRHYIEGQVTDIHLMDNQTVLITEASKHAVYRMTLTGNEAPQLILGGTAGFNNGDFAETKFHRPLAVCGDGQVAYVIDANNHLIREVDFASGRVSTLTGIQGTAGLKSGPKGQGTVAFQYAQIKAHDCTVAGDSLYFWDYKTNMRADMMRKVNLNTGYVHFVHHWKADQNHVDIASSNVTLYQFIRNNAGNLELEYRETDKKPLKHFAVFTSYQLADLDNDGTNEIVTMSNVNMQRYVHLYKRNDRDEYRYFDDVPLNNVPHAFDITRINGDSFQDLVVATTGSIRIFLGDGRGKFVEDTRLEVPTSGNVISLQMVDINGDYRQDIVGVNNKNELLIWLSDQSNQYAHGNGNSFESYNLKLPKSSSYHSLSVGRFNYDNYYDVILRELAGDSGFLLLGKKPRKNNITRQIMGASSATD